VNAVDSDLVHIEQTRPPGGQTIRVNFKFDNFQNKFHLNCPGEGSWHGQISRTYELLTEPIFALADENPKNVLV